MGISVKLKMGALLGLVGLTIAAGLAACTTETPTPTPTAQPIHVSPSYLLEMMGQVPLSWTEDGFWFSEWKRALEFSGAPRPRNLEEWAKLDADEQDRYFESFQHMAHPSKVRGMLQDSIVDSEATIGVSLFQLDSSLLSGEAVAGGPHPLYVKGEFQKEKVGSRLLDLGYEERQAAGQLYYASLRENGVELGSHPTNIFNNVYVDESTLIATGTADEMEAILATRAGENDSVLANLAFARLGEVLSDALSAGFLPRSAALTTIPKNPAVLGLPHFTGCGHLEFTRQDTWGTLHEWAAAAFAFGRDGNGEPWYAISLYYSDPTAAELDASELLHRIETYETSVCQELLDRGYPQHPFERCEAFSTDHTTYEGGSILTVRYRMIPPITTPWYDPVDERDLGFLVP